MIIHNLDNKYQHSFDLGHLMPDNFLLQVKDQQFYQHSLKKVKKNTFILALGLLILVDLWMVDRRYLNDDNFQSPRKAEEPFQMTQADKYILQDKDPNFKVLHLSDSPFNDEQN